MTFKRTKEISQRGGSNSQLSKAGRTLASQTGSESSFVPISPTSRNQDRDVECHALAVPGHVVQRPSLPEAC